MSLFIKNIFLVLHYQILAILHPTSLANLVAEVGTGHSHQILLFLVYLILTNLQEQCGTLWHFRWWTSSCLLCQQFCRWHVPSGHLSGVALEIHKSQYSTWSQGTTCISQRVQELKIQILSKFILLLLQYQQSDQVIILHRSRHLSCHDLCKIVTLWMFWTSLGNIKIHLHFLSFIDIAMM